MSGFPLRNPGLPRWRTTFEKRRKTLASQSTRAVKRKPPAAQTRADVHDREWTMHFWAKKGPRVKSRMERSPATLSNAILQNGLNGLRLYLPQAFRLRTPQKTCIVLSIRDRKRMPSCPLFLWLPAHVLVVPHFVTPFGRDEDERLIVSDREWMR